MYPSLSGSLYLFFLTIFSFPPLFASISINQTDTVSPVSRNVEELPFEIFVETANFSLPVGLQSFAASNYKGKWLIVAGRTNGLHGFNTTPAPFPPLQQNRVAYVIDAASGTTYSRSLDDDSGLTEEQINELSVTSPQFFFTNDTLYISGGYGFDTATQTFGTKSTLTAINISQFTDWVMRKSSRKAKDCIRQTSHPLLQVTGGYMYTIDPHLTCLLILGQNFDGTYTVNSNGAYTEQVRCFQIIDDGKKIAVQPRASEAPYAEYRRRDLNVIPFMQNLTPSFVALSGVFTPPGGIWTVPIAIQTNGKTAMDNPLSDSTFKQAMNNYASSFASFYSPSTKTSYVTLLGGLTYGYFDYLTSSFEYDEEIPFTNQITTIKIDKKNTYTQYLMPSEFPVILSTGSNPGNPLLFGAASRLLVNEEVSRYPNGVFNLDKITKETVLGYVVGGIMSTVPNTTTSEDSTASPYIFRVVLRPK